MRICGRDKRRGSSRRYRSTVAKADPGYSHERRRLKKMKKIASLMERHCPLFSTPTKKIKEICRDRIAWTGRPEDDTIGASGCSCFFWRMGAHNLVAGRRH